MSDISIMDYFLSKTNDKVEFKTEPDMDIPSDYDSSELMSSDFFDSILSLEKTHVDGYDLPSELFDNLEMDTSLISDGSSTYEDMQCESSTFSDSGISSDLQEIPDQILSDDELLKSILDTTPVPNNIQRQTTPQTPVAAVKPMECLNSGVVTPTVPATESEKPKIINILKPVQKSKQVIRVQPLNGGSRSVLLPINIKDLKTIKIISTNNLKAENIKITTNPVKPTKRIADNNEKFIMKPTRKCNVETAELNADATILQRHKTQATSVPVSPVATQNVKQENGEAAADDGNQYPLLLLTPEEKRLLSKDGIQLPCRYPLTKHEERELKRIRRKIRNKISAQDSRKRKKEYVDGLEERVKLCSEENRSLIKRIKLLQMQNNKLSSQLSKLQALVFKTGTSRAHPATCLMIVLLSVMLVTLPNLRNNGSVGNDGGVVDTELSTLQQYVSRRALLFSQQATNEDTSAFNMDEFVTFSSKHSVNINDDSDGILDAPINGLNNSAIVGKKNEIGGHSPPLFEYESGGGGDYLKQGIKRYIEPDIDEYWPPGKKRNLSVAEMSRPNRLNRTEYIE